MLIKSVPNQKGPTQKGRTYNIKGRENTRTRQEHHQETAIPNETEQDKNTREPQVGRGQEHDNNQGKGTKYNIKGKGRRQKLYDGKYYNIISFDTTVSSVGFALQSVYKYYIFVLQN